MVKRLIILLLLISNITVAQTYGIEDVKKKGKKKKKGFGEKTFEKKKFKRKKFSR